mgnify:CR=1 FL=1
MGPQFDRLTQTSGHKPKQVPTRHAWHGRRRRLPSLGRPPRLDASKARRRFFGFWKTSTFRRGRKLEHLPFEMFLSVHRLVLLARFSKRPSFCLAVSNSLRKKLSRACCKMPLLRGIKIAKSAGAVCWVLHGFSESSERRPRQVPTRQARAAHGGGVDGRSQVRSQEAS